MRKKLKKDCQGFYLLNHGDQVKPELAPEFAQKSIEINLSITRGKEKGGVLNFHGGSSSGYSLFLEDGRPIFCCRLGGELYTFRTSEILPGERVFLSVNVRSSGQVSLKRKEKNLAKGKLPTLFNTHPQDPLEVGNDTFSTLSNYTSSPSFNGKITEVKLRLK